ncbi:hypothetical protein DB88DRAFT_481777 [Papiliotrema laurentii]|uniref:Uncharacterized protein n=1 Tax=Papiliotrema laurentii TaxID=5418 RepID=A0AAD9FUS6_PAPLA|nr:hypothetical protein DB88DRAFT_481777 [Papiliotrema laurentii]
MVARETPSSPISRDEWDTTESEEPAKSRPSSTEAKTKGTPGGVPTPPDGPSVASFDTGHRLDTILPVVQESPIQTKDDKRMVMKAIEREQSLNVTVEDWDSPPSTAGLTMLDDKCSKAKSAGGMRYQNGCKGNLEAEQLEHWAAAHPARENSSKSSASPRKRKLQDLIDGPAPLDSVDVNLADTRARPTQPRSSLKGTGKAARKRSKANADLICLQESGIGPVIDLKPYVPRDRRRPDFYKMPPINRISSEESTMRTQTYPSMVHRGPQNKLVASLRPGMTVTPIEAIGNETVPSRGEPESENDGDDDEACENRPTSQPRRQKGRWSTLQGSISLWTPAEEAILLAHWDGRGALTTLTQLEMTRALAAQGYNRTPQAVKFRVRNVLRSQFEKKAAELAELDRGLDEDAEGESVEGND